MGGAALAMATRWLRPGKPVDVVIEVEVLTPRSTVNALAQGFEPGVRIPPHANWDRQGSYADPPVSITGVPAPRHPSTTMVPVIEGWIVQK